MPNFVVIRSRGPKWDDARPLEGQCGWREHADFMDALFMEDFVAFAGPLEGTRDALLIIRAKDEAEIAPSSCRRSLDAERPAHAQGLPALAGAAWLAR